MIRSSPSPPRNQKQCSSSSERLQKYFLENSGSDKWLAGPVPCTYKREYELCSALGEGSFGQVLLAKWTTKNGRRVAIKVLKDESAFKNQLAVCGVTYKDIVVAFEQEIALMELVGAHPNVVEILSKGYDGRMLTMEVASSDIYHIVKKVGSGLPLSLCKRWSKQVLTAVDYIHSKGVIHQDIKASNILICPDGTAKVCDFGLAVMGEGDLDIDRELLTLWYRAPELIMGSRIYNSKVDEWGVGCIMLEMLVGRVAFAGNVGAGCNCPRVSHVNYNSDQLSRIYKMIGSPLDADIENMACYCHVKSWTKYPNRLPATIRAACRGRGGLHSSMSSASLAASVKTRDAARTVRTGSAIGTTEEEEEEAAGYMLDTISRLLSFKSKSRDTAAMALEGPLFTVAPLPSLPATVRPSMAGRPQIIRAHSEKVTTGGGVMGQLAPQSRGDVRADESHWREISSFSHIDLDISPKQTMPSPASSSATTMPYLPLSRGPSDLDCCSNSHACACLRTSGSSLPSLSHYVSPSSRLPRKSVESPRRGNPVSCLGNSWRRMGRKSGI